MNPVTLSVGLSCPSEGGIGGRGGGIADEVLPWQLLPPVLPGEWLTHADVYTQAHVSLCDRLSRPPKIDQREAWSFPLLR